LKFKIAFLPKKSGKKKKKMEKLEDRKLGTSGNRAKLKETIGVGENSH